MIFIGPTIALNGAIATQPTWSSLTHLYGLLTVTKFQIVYTTIQVSIRSHCYLTWVWHYIRLDLQLAHSKHGMVKTVCLTIPALPLCCSSYLKWMHPGPKKPLPGGTCKLSTVTWTTIQSSSYFNHRQVYGHRNGLRDYSPVPPRGGLLAKAMAQVTQCDTNEAADKEAATREADDKEDDKEEDDKEDNDWEPNDRSMAGEYIDLFWTCMILNKKKCYCRICQKTTHQTRKWLPQIIVAHCQKKEPITATEAMRMKRAVGGCLGGRLRSGASK